MNFRPETLRVFRELLNNVSISAASPNFDELVRDITAAREDLAAAEAIDVAAA